MKIIQIVPGIGRESAGPSYSVPALCGGLQKAGVDVELWLAESIVDHKFGFPVEGYPRSPFPTIKLGRSPMMLKMLRQRCKVTEIVHSNGLWMFPNVYPEWARGGTTCKHVMEPRGALSSWALANSKWRKRLFGWLFQYDVLRKADMLVATARSEYEEFRALGYVQPVCILPNGIELPQLEIFGKAPRRRMFFLSRIHPKKNLEMLIRCWARLEDKFPEWDLSIVGPDKDNRYADEMKVLADHLRCKRLTFEGELNGNTKYRFMAESECEVLPTHSENFGMVVAESLVCGTPVICSHGAPWKGLELNECGWWVPTEDSAFEKAMNEAMSMSREDLSRKGGRGQEWMLRDFPWRDYLLY